jgi:hypothetical protein
MATQKLQPSRALTVIPSDNAVIPIPQFIHQGVNTGVATNKLITITGDFIFDNVKTGDVVYNTTDGTAATVVTVDSQNQLTLNANIFTLGGKSFTVYQQSSQTGIGNQGCVLYVGTGGNVRVTTSGNDIVTFTNVQDGTFFPISVIKLWATGTTATAVNALW